ncbi:MAG: hypothetical protein ACTSRX_09760, partial [Promethearchaeota archaeon]
LIDLFEDSTSFSKDKDSNKDIIKKSPKKLNKVIITRSAYNKMIIIAQEVSKLLKQSMEVYALCIGDNGIIDDILIPPQKVSSISIHINASYILSLVPYIRANNLNIIGWVHSHGIMSSFFSSTDDNNQITVLNDTSNYSEVDNIRVKYCFGITVNLREELFGIVTTQFPSGEIVHEEAIFEIQCFDNNADNTKLKEKNLLSNRDRYLIDLFEDSTSFSKDKDSNKDIIKKSPKKLNKVIITRSAKENKGKNYMKMNKGD